MRIGEVLRDNGVVPMKVVHLDLEAEETIKRGLIQKASEPSDSHFHNR